MKSKSKKKGGASNQKASKNQNQNDNENQYKTGRLKTVYLKSPFAYITSTRKQMNNYPIKITNEYFIEELRLTQIEHELFPELILNAFELDSNNVSITKKMKNVNMNIFTYKKRKVGKIVDKGIVEFIINSIDEFSDSRLPFCFTNVDIKLENIGTIDGKFIYFDNGANTFYPIPRKYATYFKNASLIIALCNIGRELGRELTAEELELIKKRITYDEMIELYQRRLRPEEILEIKIHARQFFLSNDLPFISKTILVMPHIAIHNYCRMITNIPENDPVGRFMEVLEKIGLDKIKPHIESNY
jgi:hypothetical protein